MDKVLRTVSRTFSTAALKRLASEKASADQLSIMRQVARELGLERENLTLSDYFSEAFRRLKREYRSEVVYKEAIFSWWLNRSGNRAHPSVLFEVRTGTSKLDALCLGSSAASAFEIKTEYDHLRRLDVQMLNYRQRFPLVTVVLPSRSAERIGADLPPSTGVCTLSESGVLRFLRAARPDFSAMDPGAAVSVLRREEALRLSSRFGFDLAGVPNTVFASTLRSMIAHVPLQDLAAEIAARLRARSSWISPQALRGFPVGIRATVAGSGVSREQLGNLRALLGKRL